MNPALVLFDADGLPRGSAWYRRSRLSRSPNTGSVIAHFGLFGGTADPIDLETTVGTGLLCAGEWLVL